MGDPNMRHSSHRYLNYSRIYRICNLLFATFFIFVAAPAFSATTPARVPVVFNNPLDLAVGKDNRIYILQNSPQQLLVVDRLGKILARYELPELKQPIALEINRTRDMLYVLNTDRVTLVNLDGTVAGSFWHGLESPIDLAVDVGANVFIADKSGSISVYSPDGKLITSFSTAESDKQQANAPSCIAIDGKSRVFLGDPTHYRVQCYTYIPDPAKFTFIESSPALAGTSDIAITSENKVMVFGRRAFFEDGGAVRLLDNDFYPSASFCAYSSEQLSQNGAVAVGPDDKAYILDRDKGYVYILPQNLSEPFPVAEPSDTSCKISWKSYMPGDGYLTYHEDTSDGAKGKWNTVKAVRSSDSLSVTLTGLKRSTRYEYRIYPSLARIPKVNATKTYRFTSASAEGKMQLLSFDVIVAIYLKSNIDGIPYELPSVRLGDKLQKEFEKARLFYLRNSHFKLNIKLDYVVIDDKTAVVTDGWIEPVAVRKDLKEALVKQNKRLENFDSIVAVYAEPGYDANDTDYTGCVGGGGLTPFGYSVFGMGGKLAWLFMHEYHHQIDAFFYKSGLPEYWLNHPDGTLCPGKYGNHWDLNAYILRQWPVSNWLSCEFGSIIETDDRDGDGVPDADPRLALDEARLGSDRMKVDTDGDGLSDLDEAMAGIYDGANPKDADTDGDGIPDGKDACPLFAVQQDRSNKGPKLDGVISEGEWQKLYPFRAETFEGESYLQWSDGNLCFAVNSRAPVQMHLEIDPDNDGYFQGELVEVDVWALTTDQPCKVKGPEGTTAVSRSEGGKTVVELMVPLKKRNGEKVTKGDRIGFHAIISGRGSTCHLFEPWTLTSFRLGE